MIVPATTDAIQEVHGKLEVPEIRVWCHPHMAKNPSHEPDYYRTFPSFAEALDYIQGNSIEAEAMPLVAFRGYELNLWGMHTEYEEAQVLHEMLELVLAPLDCLAETLTNFLPQDRQDNFRKQRNLARHQAIHRIASEFLGRPLEPYDVMEAH